MGETSPASLEGGRRRVALGRARVLYLLPFVVFAGLAGLFALRLGWGGDPSRLPSALIGKPVPRFDLPPVPGLRGPGGEAMPGLSDAALRSGRPTVVNVWASWCGPCRLEHPLLMELARDPAVAVVGVNYKDNPESARRFLGSLGNPYAAVGRDESGRTAIDWGVYGVPETFLVGPDGRILAKQVGPLTPELLPELARKAKAAARP